MIWLAIENYWRISRAPRYSLLLVLPLVLAYELLAATLPGGAGGVRNGADAILRGAMFSLAGPYGPPALGLVVVLICAWLFFRDLRSSGGDLKPRVLLVMGLEAAILASLLGLLVAAVTVQILHPFQVLALQAGGELTVPERLMVSLGAGVYEELLFRVILVSVLTFAAREVLGWRGARAAIPAVLISAVVFSLFHYVGSHGDVFTVPSFMFRLVAGVFFSALYVLRGFGITAWTHALYDVYLLF
jgi:hypothetical protein